MARLLIEHGAEVNAKDKNGETPLHKHKAAFDNSLDVARLLIEHGANTDGIDLSWMDIPQKERQTAQPRPVTDPQKEYSHPDARDRIDTTGPAPRPETTPAETKWTKVVWEMRRSCETLRFQSRLTARFLFASRATP